MQPPLYVVHHLERLAGEAGKVESVAQLLISHRAAQNIHFIRTHNWSAPFKYVGAGGLPYKFWLSLLTENGIQLTFTCPHQKVKATMNDCSL